MAGRRPEEICAVDLETSGLDPLVDQIIEIGLVRVGRDGRTREFASLVRAPSSGPVEIHGISGAELRDAPPLELVLPTVQAMLRGAALVAHNAAFDVAFLRAAGVAVPQRIVCTRQLDTRGRPDGASSSLSATCARHGVDQGRAHRALADARAAAALYRTLVARDQAAC